MVRKSKQENLHPSSCSNTTGSRGGSGSSSSDSTAAVAVQESVAVAETAATAGCSSTRSKLFSFLKEAQNQLLRKSCNFVILGKFCVIFVMTLTFKRGVPFRYSGKSGKAVL